MGRYQSGPCPTLIESLICSAASPNEPPRLVSISLESGKHETLYDPNSQLRSKLKLTTERITWKNDFGRESFGVLVYPLEFEQGRRYPLVITTYSCRGFLQGGTADGGPEYALAEVGFFVLCIDFNWDTPTEAETEGQSLAPSRYVAALSEYETGISNLVDRGVVDSTRVGISGFSFSSQAISYALSHTDSFQVASLRSLGVLDPTYEIFYHPNAGVTSNLMRVHNISSDDQDADAVFDDISVSLRTNYISAPILVQASEGEHLSSLAAFTALTKANKPVEMYVFPNETHVLHQPYQRLVNFRRNLDWFRFWLQGYEDHDPEKATQYERWRKLRDKACGLSREATPSFCG